MLLPFSGLAVSQRAIEAMREALKESDALVDPEMPGSPTISDELMEMKKLGWGLFNVTLDVDFDAIAKKGSKQDCRLFAGLAGMQAVVVRALGDLNEYDPSEVASTEAYCIYSRRMLLDAAVAAPRRHWRH